jgi:hypothetical protein
MAAPRYPSLNRLPTGSARGSPSSGPAIMEALIASFVMCHDRSPLEWLPSNTRSIRMLFAGGHSRTLEQPSNPSSSACRVCHNQTTCHHGCLAYGSQGWFYPSGRQRCALSIGYKSSTRQVTRQKPSRTRQKLVPVGIRAVAEDSTFVPF